MRAQVVGEGARDEIGPPGVDGQGPNEAVVVEVAHHPPVEEAGDVEHQGRVAEGRLDLVAPTPDVCFRGDVDASGVGSSARGIDRADGLGRIRFVDVGAGDERSLVGQLDGEDPAQTAPGARDHGHPFGNAIAHDAHL